jgi:hypothetical protein
VNLILPWIGKGRQNSSRGDVNRLVLPNAHHSPARRHQGAVVTSIPLDIALELCLPIRLVLRGRCTVLGAAVPEAPIHEHREPLTSEDHVGATPESRERRIVNSETKPSSVELPP